MLWGRVESSDSVPLTGAQVFLREPEPCGALTDMEGRYVLEAVPRGAHSVIFQLLGYESDSLEVEVAGDTVHATVRLRPMQVKVDDMIVRPLMEPADSLPVDSTRPRRR